MLFPEPETIEAANTKLRAIPAAQFWPTFCLLLFSSYSSAAPPGRWLTTTWRLFYKRKGLPAPHPTPHDLY